MEPKPTAPSQQPAFDPAAPTLTYKLKRPINVGGELTTQITCREANGFDLENFLIGRDGVPIGDLMSIISRCSGIPKPHLQLAKAADILGMVGTFGPFFGLGAESGDDS